VLFTADLKSFASYGLPTPSPSPHLSTPARQTERTEVAESQTPPLTPVPTPQKRKQSEIDCILPRNSSHLPSCSHNEEPKSSLADRVKKRKRIGLPPRPVLTGCTAAVARDGPPFRSTWVLKSGRHGSTPWIVPFHAVPGRPYTAVYGYDYIIFRSSLTLAYFLTAVSMQHKSSVDSRPAALRISPHGMILSIIV